LCAERAEEEKSIPFFSSSACAVKNVI